VKRKQFILLMAIFASGFCGMVAEFSVGTTVSYLLGNSIAAYTVSISVFMLAMGIGAIVSRQFPEGRELQMFLFIECALSVAAAGSTIFITQAARLGLAWVATVAISLLIGMLIGFEIPLLSRFNEQRKIVLKDNLAMVFGADYIGSFVAGMSYAWLLLPTFGTVLTPVFSGAINLVLAVMMGLVFLRAPKMRTARKGLGAFAVCSAVALTLLGLHGEDLAFDAEASLFKDPIVYVEQTSYQKIMMTEMKGRFCLHLNGGTQFCSHDEKRYHEMLVHPAMWVKPDARRVLVLGGGDGLAVRELLKYENVESITLVDLDPRMVELCSTHPIIIELNKHAFDDPRVTTVARDAYIWLQENLDIWDVIIIDLPDPRRVELAKLYSTEFYTTVRNHLNSDGVMVAQSTSPIHATEAFTTIWHTIGASGLNVLPYRANVPSFGDWGFNLAVRNDHMNSTQLRERLDAFEETVPLEVLNQDAVQAAMRFEKGIFPDDPEELAVSRLIHPTVHEAYQSGAWKDTP
jgi:spermidine synthase